MIHWVIEYDEKNPIYSAITKRYLWKIRHSDGKWMLSRKRKNLPGPYSVYGAYRGLATAKQVAEEAG